MEDLGAASLDDAKEWFKTYYGPQNAVVVVAGDVKAEEVKAKVERYFGDIPPGPPIAKHDVWIAKRTGDAPPDAPGPGPPGARLQGLEHAGVGRPRRRLPGPGRARAAASGKSSRLFKRLVYDDQIATDVSARQGVLRDREHLRRPGHGAAGRRPRRGGEGARRGDGAPPAGRPHGRGGRAGEDGAARRLRARRRAHRRVRRQVRRPRPEPGLGRPARLLPDPARAREGGGHGGGVGGGEALALGRRLRARGPPLPRARGGSRAAPTARPDPFPARRRRGDLPAFRRATLPSGLEAHRGRAPRGAGRPDEPAGRRRLRLGPVRGAGHRAPRRRHDGRGHEDADRPADQRRAAAAGGAARHRVRPRLDLGDALRAEGEPRSVARALRGRGAEPGLPGRRARPAQEAAARRDRAGGGAAVRDGAAGAAAVHLRDRARLRAAA